MTQAIDPTLFSGFYKLDIDERINRLETAGLLGENGALTLKHQGYVLSTELANQMIENVVGVFGLPLGLVTHVCVNGSDYLVPMVVEEPSIVAAASAAARLARANGGFQASLDSSLLIGQIELHALTDRDATRRTILDQRDVWLARANDVHPNLVQRGGGVRDIEVIDGERPSSLVIHLLVDTCDAMGANLVNTQCEALAPQLEKALTARAGLRILSNLADRSVVRATMRVPTDQLQRDNLSGREVAERVVAANEFALASPHRAATHNKGIMNGIDPIAIATGNDWRAVEAGAHAYAARDGQYRGLTTWAIRDDVLVGELRIPLKVGTVGASLKANPGTQFATRLLGIQRSKTLAEIMAAVGLGQNFSALRALSTSGIQAGHMRLHARSVVQSAGVPEEFRAAVTRAVIRSGEIKEWKAVEILATMRKETDLAHRQRHMAAGKVILGGEHAVVYGHRAIALPLPDALGVSVTRNVDDDAVLLRVPAWRLSKPMDIDARTGVDAMVASVLATMEIEPHALQIDVSSEYPAGIGLGSSASFAVGLARALAAFTNASIDDEIINDIAYESERVAHGHPSGLDNTLATFARPVAFRRGPPATVKPLTIQSDLQLLIMLTANTTPTADMVARVASLQAAQPAHVAAIFTRIDEICADLETCLASGEFATLGELMNLNHGLLNTLGVSSAETEALVELARRHGALGAKMTGGGGGGAVIALPGEQSATAALLKACEARKIPHYLVNFSATK